MKKIKKIIKLGLVLSVIPFAFAFIFYILMDNVSAAIVGDGVFMYDQTTPTTNVQTRIWDDTTKAVSSASSPFAGNGTSKHVYTKSSKTRQEILSGIQDSTGLLTIYKSTDNGASWVSQWTATVGDGNLQRFEIAYEQTSGDALVVYSANVATTNEIKYQTWNGTSWSGALNLDPIRTSGTIYGIKDAERSGSDEIGIVWVDTNMHMSTNLWTGSAWYGEPTDKLISGTYLTASRSGGASPSAVPTRRSFDLAFESLSGDLMVVWGNDTLTTTQVDPKYIIKTAGGAWGAAAGTAIANLSEDGESIEIDASPTSDRIALSTCSVDTGADCNFITWSGTAWGTVATDTTSGAAIAGESSNSIKWLVDGANQVAIMTYNDAAGGGIDSYFSINGATPAVQTDNTLAPVVTGLDRSVMVKVNPVDSREALFIFEDANSDIFVKRAYLTGTTVAWSNPVGLSTAIETNASIAGFHPIGFDYVRYVTPLPGISLTLGKTTESWGGAIPVYGALTGGITNTSYPYARVKVVTAAAETYYTNMTWDATDSRFEGVFYPGSYYCNGCVDPTTGTFTVTAELDNNSGFPSIDYSSTNKTFTTFIARRRSSLDAGSPTNYTDFNPVWVTDHWAYTVKDLAFYQISGATKTNVAIGIPFHPITSTITNIGVTFGGVTVNPGTAESTSNAWWWDDATHTLFIQVASLLNSTNDTNLTDIDITFNSDTDLWASRYDHTETSDMGERLFWNGLMIANQYYTTFVYGGGHEGSGMQAESRGHEPGADDDTTDCMERVAVHVDDTPLADASGHYQYDIKWKQNEWKDYIFSEDNNNIVVINNSDNTASTGWIQQLNNDISTKRTQTYKSGEKYIDNLYEFTNNDTVSHKLPMVWQREQWLSSHTTPLNSARSLLDEGRYYGDTADVTIETRYPMTNYDHPWMTSYDSGVFNMMGIIFDKTNVDASTYGFFAGEPVLATGIGEWPLNITVPNSTPGSYPSDVAHQTGFEHTFNNVAPATTVSFHFAQIMYDSTSLQNLLDAIEADYLEYNPSLSVITQSGYGLFGNTNTGDVGSALASQNTPVTLTDTDNFRLRLLLKTSGALTQGQKDFKLQFAPKVGQCDVSFAGESYTDVTDSTIMSYYNNFYPDNGIALIPNASDPINGGDTIVNQSYVEQNNFTNNVGTIPVGQLGKWDFPLYYRGATSNDSYCFRVVNSNGSLLDVYSYIPEVITKTLVIQRGGTVNSIIPTQCSDTVDNNDPEDTLVDTLDPQCHVGGVLGNEYMPNWDNETVAPSIVTGGGQGNGGTIVLPQCSDTTDNDIDTFTDINDPNCHMDGQIGNEYKPLWDSETNSPVSNTGGSGNQGGGGELGFYRGKIKSFIYLMPYETLKKILLAMAYAPL